MKIRFEIDETKWNFVSEKGMPEDGEWCFVVWKADDGEYDYHIGGYNEQENTFYMNFGLEGCVLEADNVVAWTSLFEEDQNYLKVVDEH